MRVLFKDLAIGQVFHNGKSKGAGANSHLIYWEEFEKTSKSTATCVAQINFGANRNVGEVKRFSANNTVYLINKDL
jgi:hypothetical protein